MLWNSVEIAAATGTDAPAFFAVDGISKDSRTVRPRDMYVAIKGESFDGHDFASAALEKGAACVMVERLPIGVPAAKAIVVPDVMSALRRMAVFRSKQADPLRIAVTGSYGKTSTKEMLRLALGPQTKIHATSGGNNNHIGLHWTLCEMPKDTQAAILEMGMNHAGELADLSRLARPNLALVTNVGIAHLEFFGNTEGIARAKAEVFLGMKRGERAVANVSSAHFDILKQAAESRGVTLASFGDTDGDARLLDYDGRTITADVFGKRISYVMAADGRHQALNSVGALCITALAGFDVRRAAESLKDMVPPEGRGAAAETAVDGKTIMLVDDSYNGNPDSTAAALAVLGQRKGRKIAVLGDMLELGDRRQELHDGLKDPIMSNRIDKVFAVGPMMKSLFDSLPAGARGAWTGTSKEMIPLLRAALRDGDTVTVKGSKGTKMTLIVQDLKKSI